MKKIPENTKITLTVGQIRRLVKEVSTGDNRVWRPRTPVRSRCGDLEHIKAQCLKDIEPYAKKIESQPDVAVDMDKFGDAIDNGNEQDFLSETDPEWNKAVNEWWNTEFEFFGEQLDVDDWSWETYATPADLMTKWYSSRYDEILNDVAADLYSHDSLTTKDIAAAFLKELALDFAGCILEEVRPERIEYDDEY